MIKLLLSNGAEPDALHNGRTAFETIFSRGLGNIDYFRSHDIFF